MPWRHSIDALQRKQRSTTGPDATCFVISAAYERGRTRTKRAPTWGARRTVVLEEPDEQQDDDDERE